MTRVEAELAFKKMLALLRQRAGALSRDQVTSWRSALRALAGDISRNPLGAGQLTPSQRDRLLRAITEVLGQVRTTLRTQAAEINGRILGQITADFTRVHVELFRAAELPTGGIVTRFRVVTSEAQRALAARARGGASLGTVVDRNVADARAAASAYLREVTGKVPTEEAVGAISRMLRGELPVNIGGLDTTDLTPLRSLGARGDRILATESFSSLREGNRVATRQSPIVDVAQWTLSDRHTEVDVCDELAEADSGYGPGWYPASAWPRAPHPYCGCYQGAMRVIPVAEWPGAGGD